MSEACSGAVAVRIIQVMKVPACVVVVGLTVCACNQSTPTDPQPQTVTQSEPKPDPVVKEAVDPGAGPELLHNKLGPYQACFTASRLVVARHFARANEHLAGRKSAPVTAMPEALIVACEQAVGEGRALQPKLPELEDALAAYAESTRAYWDLANGLQDKLAAKKTRDPQARDQLEAAYDTWESRNFALHKLLDKHQSEVERRQLADIEGRAGKNLEYLVHTRIFAIRPVAACVAQFDVTAGACKQPIEALQSAHTALKTYVDGHADEVAAVAKLAEFLTAADAQTTQLTKLLETLEKAPKQSGEALAAASESAARLVAQGATLAFPKG